MPVRVRIKENELGMPQLRFGVLTYGSTDDAGSGTCALRCAALRCIGDACRDRRRSWCASLPPFPPAHCTVVCRNVLHGARFYRACWCVDLRYHRRAQCLQRNHAGQTAPPLPSPPLPSPAPLPSPPLPSPPLPSHLISSPLLNVAWWHTPTQFPTAKHCPRCCPHGRLGRRCMRASARAAGSAFGRRSSPPLPR
jgi:hypothetical protein